MKYLMFLLLIFLDLIFSVATSFLVLNRKIKKIDRNSSCGTGSLGKIFFTWIFVAILFVVLLGIYGSLLYWIMFLLL